MNKWLSPSVLSLVVGASAMASLILCAMHIQYTQKIRSIQGVQQQLLAVQQRRAMMRQLGADLQAYSKTNPAIRPLLDSVTPKSANP